MPFVPVAELKDYVGKELGRSEWLTIDQARINLDVEAPVTGASMAIFYASGVVFAVASGLLLLIDLWRLLSGQIADDELVQVTESEDLASVEDLHLDRTGTPHK